jgi:Protein of unknown function (DUF1326)
MSEKPHIDWRITGVSFGNCNCSYGCPCQFQALPTHGHCQGFEVFRIAAGHFGDVRLDGLHAVLAYAWPGPIFKGGGRDAGDHRRARRRPPSGRVGHRASWRGDGAGRDPRVGLPRHVEHGAPGALCAHHVQARHRGADGAGEHSEHPRVGRRPPSSLPSASGVSSCLRAVPATLTSPVGACASVR